jgi:leader peptidase (prepilin peptidase)/N-methyltransferase
MGLLALVGRFLLGWLAGLIVNLLADQLPVRRGVGQPVCAHCAHALPLSQYILLEKCQSCQRNPSSRRYLVQWFLSLAFLSLNIWLPARLLAVEASFILVLFSLLVVVDLEHRLILHPVSIIGACLGLIVGIRLHGPTMTLLGGIVGFGVMLALYWLGELFSAYLAKRRGKPVEEVALGFGDVNLGGVLGLFLGWPGITAGLFIAILAGGFISAIVLLAMVVRRRYQALTALPYAPFLIFSAAVLMFRP